MDKQQAKPSDPEPELTLQGLNDGQRKINGQLCIVDQTLIDILRLLRIALTKVPKLAKEDFTKIDELLKKAYNASHAVAHVKPPGCEPVYPPDPKWGVMP